jgi:RpiR family transcriptional regulator, carbohydrate utilization regulator
MSERMRFITDHYGRLRKSEVKVADYVLEHAEEVIHDSMSELAEQAKVSEPTVIRFCRGLGFKGFQDFKIHLAQNVIPAVRSIHESVNEGEEAPELIRKVFDANIAAVRSTLDTLDFAAVQPAIQELARAKKIVFHGLGGSAVVAMDAYHKFFRTRIPCEWYSDGHMALMAASMMRPGDFFVAISHSGASRDIVEALEVAKAAGATTLAIVSYSKSPVSKIAQRTLCVASSETGYRFEPTASRIAQLCVIDVLSVGVSLLRSEEVIANLNRSRKALARKRY